MSDLVGNPEDRFSHNEAHFIVTRHQLIADVDMDLKRMQKRGMSCTGFMLMCAFIEMINAIAMGMVITCKQNGVIRTRTTM